MVLTIAIPTYNRPDKIKNTVQLLLPQLTPEVTVLILDNCSPINVKDHLQQQIGGDVLEKVEVIRHRINIGGDANFQRCFELCDTPYIWMLGDDDIVESNAVEIILKEIEHYKHLDLVGINFKTNCMEYDRPAPIIIKGTTELSNKLDHFGNWLFISASVYKTDVYRENLRYQGWGTYSLASQLVPAMIAISENKSFVLSEKYLVTNVPEDAAVKWSNFQLALSLPTLLEAPVGFRQDEFLQFGKKMEPLCGIYPGDELYIILKSINYNVDLIDRFHIHIYQQQFWRSYIFRSNRSTQLFQYYICLFLLKNKGLLGLLLKLVPKLKRKSEEHVPYYLFKRS